MHYIINLEKNIIYCTFSDILGADEIIDFIQLIRKDPDFNNNLNTICDIRELIIIQGFTLIPVLANFVKQTSKERGSFKLSLLISKENKDNAHLYKVLTSDEHVKECFNMQDAEAWATSNPLTDEAMIKR